MSITLTFETRREWEIYEQDLKHTGGLAAMKKLEALHRVLYTMGDRGVAIIQDAEKEEREGKRKTL
jgi:hypothetical protein